MFKVHCISEAVNGGAKRKPTMARIEDDENMSGWQCGDGCKHLINLDVIAPTLLVERPSVNWDYIPDLTALRPDLQFARMTMTSEKHDERIVGLKLHW